MNCTDKEWQHCRVEKMKCEGCYYNYISKDKIRDEIDKIDLLISLQRIVNDKNDNNPEKYCFAKKILQELLESEK